MVTIIDYEAGNIKSVENAVRFLGRDAVLTRDPEVILSSELCILPGVGAFGDAMARLKRFGLDEVIKETVKREIPFLGICLGLQLLFEASEESPGTEGLGILKGKILRIPDSDGRKVPQIGWNDLSFPRPGRLFSFRSRHCYGEDRVRRCDRRVRGERKRVRLPVPPGKKRSCRYEDPREFPRDLNSADPGRRRSRERSAHAHQENHSLS